MAIRVGIHGAAGRMGQRLIALAPRDLNLVAALEHSGHPQLGTDAGTIAGVPALGVPLSTTLSTAAEVIIDFSVPPAALAILATCVEARFRWCWRQPASTRPARQDPQRRSDDPHSVGAHMSLAVNLAMKLAETPAERWPRIPRGPTSRSSSGTIALRKTPPAAPRSSLARSSLA